MTPRLSPWKEFPLSVNDSDVKENFRIQKIIKPKPAVTPALCADRRRFQKVDYRDFKSPLGEALVRKSICRPVRLGETRVSAVIQHRLNFWGEPSSPDQYPPYSKAQWRQHHTGGGCC